MSVLIRLKAWLKWWLSDIFYRTVPRRWPDKSAIRPGVNLVGYAHAEMGLGEALRNTALALEDVQVPFLVRQLDVPLLNRQENRSLDPYVSEYCTYAVNLIGVNPDLLYRIATWVGYKEWSRRYNVGYWFWELAKFPEAWRYTRHLVDEVWVNTEFVADAVRSMHPRVFKMPFAVAFEPPDARFTRAYFGLPAEGTHFLFSFDLNSSTARKNPEAVVQAFQQAFPVGDEPVVLVVKSINAERAPAASQALRERLKHDPRIFVMDDYLSTEAMRGLLNVADCYVSLHRAEGLGLGMAESMFLGKPVIATAYSGNMEFMNPGNALLVPYRLVPVAKGDYPFAAGQVWAEPDVSAAAAHMRHVLSAPAEMAQLGAAAQTYMQANHSIEGMGTAIAHRLEAIDRQLGGRSC